MRWAVLVAVAACNGRDPMVLVDAAPPPIAYSLHVGEQARRPVADRPVVYIDGVATSSVSQTYPPDETAFLHHVELHYEDHIVAALDVSADTEDCNSIGSDARGALLSVGESLDAYDSGDLRYTSDAIQFEHAGCLGDAF